MKVIMPLALLMALTIMLIAVPVYGAVAAGPVLTGADVVALGPDGDGSIVTVQGEAIGDILRGGPDHVWVNVLSGGTAVGVWMPREYHDAVDTLGDYHNRGSEVRATGTFNFACNTHGGDLDIHATSFTLVTEGSPIGRPIAPYKPLLAIGLTAAVGLQAALLARSRRREL